MITNLFFHGDADGCCAAAIASLDMEDVKLIPVLDAANFKPKIRTGDTIILDLGSQLTPADIRELQKKGNVLVIDHHVSKRLPCPHINPRLSGDKPLPAAFLAYKMVGKKSMAWIGAVGLIGDWGVKLAPTFLKKVRSRWPSLLKHVTQEEIYFEDKIGTMARAIDATVSVHGEKGALYVVKRLQKNIDSPSRFLDDKKLLSSLKRIEKEVAKVLKKVEHHRDKSYVEFSSKLPVKSAVAQKLKAEHKYKTIMVSQKRGRRYRLSLRSDKYDLNGLISHCGRGLDAYGGGHDKAAGASVAASDYKTFKERFLKYE